MSTVTSIPTGTYAVDPTHSNVGFEIKHLGIATVRGAFKTFTGNIEVSDAGLTASGSVDVASVDTGNTDRDGHLKTADIFDAEQFPQITFSASSAEFSGDEVTLTGEITIKGVTKPITLSGEALTATDEDPWGNQRVGFEVEATIDRTDFGVSFNQTLGSGNLMVANKVKLVVSVSAVKAA